MRFDEGEMIRYAYNNNYTCVDGNTDNTVTKMYPFKVAQKEYNFYMNTEKYNTNNVEDIDFEAIESEDKYKGLVNLVKRKRDG